MPEPTQTPPPYVRYDEQGKPYYIRNDGAKIYFSPVAFGEKPPEDNSGFFRKRPQWNGEKGKWETPFDWGKLVTIGTGAGLGAGALSAAGVFGGAAGGGSTAGAGTTLPSTVTTPTMAGGLPAGAASGAVPAAGTLGADLGTMAVLPSTPIGTGMGTLPAGTPSGIVSKGSVFSRIGDLLKDPSNLADLAKAVGSYGQTQAGNRETTGNFTKDYDRLRLAAEQDRRLAEADALKKLAQGAYIQGGGNPYTPPKIPGLYIPSYGFGPKAPAPIMQQAAQTLEGQLMARLQPGAGFQPTPLSSYAKPGTGEKISNIASIAIPALGWLGKLFGK